MTQRNKDAYPYKIVKRGGKYIIISPYDGRKVGALK